MANMMVAFSCSNCDAQFTKWTGRCLECGKWGTIEKTEIGNWKLEIGGKANEYSSAKTVGLEEIKGLDVTRTKTGIGELDRVLGGGIVPGSLTLLGGEPGIGKSTLCLQLATAVPNTLYISAEESIGQIKIRADRLRLNSPTLKLANVTSVESIVATMTAGNDSSQTSPPVLSSVEERKNCNPSPPQRRGQGEVSRGFNLVIVDSIQTIFSQEVEGESGSPTQIRACTTKLMEAAKTNNIPVILIGHVTKEGIVAGPKLLEHLVDAVLYLEGDQHHLFRILRTIKNRFGATDEVGVFQMEEEGLKEVKNPSASFLEERGDNAPGNIVTCLMEGTRPILVEIQALVNKTAFGYPARKASGFDINRLHLLIAVLQKRAGLRLEQYDVHLNVVGGLQADEPAADLAVAMAIASAYKDKALGHDLAVFGEIGLGGEVRPIAQAEKRIKECEQLGMKRIITSGNKKLEIRNWKLKVIEVKNIQELIKQAG